ncbi:carbohydrate ABC transporter permease [Paenibacillus nasutitermitis]|uniref:Protein LplC n=1 Tax=Paenibacillus nasutitermitis TaxID=1652958 RepID=A0A916Z6U2_9BACL|nr:carbohydrate ABC transporter permease [Paenibacillus nasutitermitis]GGD78811.1 protein LplC [Paenibacillus nasutitermitis]
MNKTWSSRLFDAGNGMFLILLSVITLYPLWHEISLSLSSKAEALQGGFFFWPRAFTMQAYTSVLTSDYIWVAYGNTIFVTVAGTVLSLLVTSSMAYPLAKKTLPWKNVWLSIVVFTMIFSGGMIPVYLVVKQLGLLNTLWALVLPNLVTAFNVIIVINFIRGIPEEVEESAMIDGANPIRIYFSIIVPLCKPVLATLALWIAVGQWNNFFQALIYLNDKALTTLPLLIRQIIAGQQLAEETGQLADSSTESVIAATIILSIIPILAVYPFLQRYFVKGVMLGSVKS